MERLGSRCMRRRWRISGTIVNAYGQLKSTNIAILSGNNCDRGGKDEFLQDSNVRQRQQPSHHRSVIVFANKGRGELYCPAWVAGYCTAHEDPDPTALNSFFEDVSCSLPTSPQAPFYNTWLLASRNHCHFIYCLLGRVNFDDDTAIPEDVFTIYYLLECSPLVGVCSLRSP